MPPHTCGICLKSYIYYDSLKRHMRTKHPTNENEEKVIKRSKANDGFRNVMCNICGQLFGSPKHLKTHVRPTNHVQIEDQEKHSCMYCFKLFSTPRELDNHIREMHSLKEKHLEPHRSKMVFTHPFTMIVAGPTRSGKTSWVVSILKNRHSQIKPTPSRIVFCYMHWQPMYLDLESLIPDIEWYDAMPTEETFESFPNSIVILDDMMADVVDDSKMMKVFTERSHHQNISVIFMTQNIFHPGRRARTISLNTQYMVLFDNPRDRQQIRTLASQMYPGDSSNFMDKFKKATSKPYGKLILDLRPNVLEKDRFLNEENEHDSASTNQKYDNLTMTKMYSNQLRQQRETLRYEDPYKLKAIDIQSKMDKLLKNTSIPENLKSTRYNELLQDYQLMISKSKNQSKNADTNSRTFNRNQVIPITNTQNRGMNLTTVQSASAADPNFKTPSFAVRQLTPPSSLHRPEETPLISFGDADNKKERSESASPEPESPTSSNDIPLPEAYPSPSSYDIANDKGDSRHQKSFISLSDDEETKVKKQRRSMFKLRKRVADKQDQSHSRDLFKDQQATPLKKYFLRDVKPHQIPLPSDSSDDANDERRSYNPDVYPEGTLQDIRDDIGDAHHSKSFVTLDDDEGEKERKQERAEYKFRKRVSKKRKTRDKPY